MTDAEALDLFTSNVFEEIWLRSSQARLRSGDPRAAIATAAKARAFGRQIEQVIGETRVRGAERDRPLLLAK